jgi:hypothetical protein
MLQADAANTQVIYKIHLLWAPAFWAGTAELGWAVQLCVDRLADVGDRSSATRRVIPGFSHSRACGSCAAR